MSSLKILAAAVAAATFGLAYAQTAPPQPASNPAVGAGQRSTQNTPMGTTGTPGGGAAAQGSTAGSTAGATGAASSGSMSSGSTAGATTSPRTSMAAGSGGGTRTTVATRRVRTDRN